MHIFVIFLIINCYDFALPVRETSTNLEYFLAVVNAVTTSFNKALGFS